MKLCGPKEWCFEHGEQWGHLGNVMCKNLYEDKDNVSKCSVYKTSVEEYLTQEELQFINKNK